MADPAPLSFTTRGGGGGGLGVSHTRTGPGRPPVIGPGDNNINSTGKSARMGSTSDTGQRGSSGGFLCFAAKLRPAKPHHPPPCQPSELPTLQSTTRALPVGLAARSTGGMPRGSICAACALPVGLAARSTGGMPRGSICAACALLLRRVFLQQPRLSPS